MERIIYNKPAINIDKQIELLKSRNLNIPNLEYAKTILSNITYYRLSAYMKVFQNNDIFNDNVSFEDIVYLYDFDKDLKSLIFESIRIIEITLRTKICLHMCTNYGPHWFYDKNNFRNEQAHNKTIEIFNDEKELAKDTFIKYYFEKYSSPDLPPFWMISEVLSFGNLSKILSRLHNNDIKQISKELTPNFYTQPVIVNWIHVLANIRNFCAHHSRLWNRQLKIKLSKPQKIVQWEQNSISIDNIYGVCFVIALLLKNNPYNNFESQLKQLFIKYHNIDLTKMGFPSSWTGFNI